MRTTRYGMAIDTKRCIGCWTCAVTCKMENNLPDDVWWGTVLTIGGSEPDTPSGVWPHLKMGFLPLMCQHCANPPCVAKCPVGATYRREDGVVLQDVGKCAGCRYCMSACPYIGARCFNWGEPSYGLDFPVGSMDAPVHERFTVSKCNLCVHLIDTGKLPACIDTCPGHARFFGDLNDAESEVSKKLAERRSFQILLGKETDPSVFYLS